MHGLINLWHSIPYCNSVVTVYGYIHYKKLVVAGLAVELLKCHPYDRETRWNSAQSHRPSIMHHIIYEIGFGKSSTNVCAYTLA